MKRVILLLFAAVIAFSSCEETIEDNSPALQGQVDSIFFKANDIRGEQNADGSITIQGIREGEKITINLPGSAVGTYPLGIGTPGSAIYTDAGDNDYTTETLLADGSINISGSCLECGWLTGSFQFSAYREGIDTLSVTVDKGFFFEVSYLDGGVDGGIPINGEMTAKIDGVDFEANSVIVEEDAGFIVINGFKDNVSIMIKVPANAVSGNYELPQAGYEASYTVDGETFEADPGGLISVNFNNQTTKKIKIFFNFVAGGTVITNGDTSGEY
ncbi:MAG: DUF6252 family protein [Bacteroidota bacterium]